MADARILAVGAHARAHARAYSLMSNHYRYAEPVVSARDMQE